MMKIKAWLLIVAILSSAFLFAGCGSESENVILTETTEEQLPPPENVFEEIYNVMLKAESSSDLPAGFRLIIYNHDIPGKETKWLERDDYRDCGTRYTGESLDDAKYGGMNLFCVVSPKKQLEIRVYHEPLQSQRDYRSVFYDFETKTLTRCEDDTHFLFEVALPAWLNGAGESSAFTLQNLGEYTEVTP